MSSHVCAITCVSVVVSSGRKSYPASIATLEHGVAQLRFCVRQEPPGLENLGASVIPS
jgi:hypothetical protein